MGELQAVNDITPFQAILWIFYPMGLLVGVELLLRALRDDDDDDHNKSVKCITHDLWDDLENHINDFFDKIKLADLTRKKNEK